MISQADKDALVAKIDTAGDFAAAVTGLSAAERDPIVQDLSDAKAKAEALATPIVVPPTTIPGALPTQVEDGGPAVMPTPGYYWTAIRARGASSADNMRDWLNSHTTAVPHRPRWGLEFSGNNMPAGKPAFWAFVKGLGEAELGTVPPQPPAVPDSVVTVSTAAQITAKRDLVNTYLWGSPTLPTTKPASRTLNVANPWPGLAAARVDTLHFTGYNGEAAFVWHVIPQGTPRSRVVFLNCGHQGSCTPSAFGPATRRVLDYLIPRGWSVVVYNMPLCGADHNPMFAAAGDAAMKFFFYPILFTLNYFEDPALVQADGIPTYTSAAMVGASGGGWTTAVYSAVDTRIKVACATAGSLPLNMRYNMGAAGESIGDAEQSRTSLYVDRAGYRDLYALSASGRRLLNIHNNADTCCFGPNQFNATAFGKSFAAALADVQTQVRAALTSSGGGAFTAYIDMAATGHTISPESLPLIEAELLA